MTQANTFSETWSWLSIGKAMIRIGNECSVSIPVTNLKEQGRAKRLKKKVREVCESLRHRGGRCIESSKRCEGRSSKSNREWTTSRKLG